MGGGLVPGGGTQQLFKVVAGRSVTCNHGGGGGATAVASVDASGNSFINICTCPYGCTGVMGPTRSASYQNECTGISGTFVISLDGVRGDGFCPW